jgi:murein L,D-transpeptidase YcbB/YkuD
MHRFITTRHMLPVLFCGIALVRPAFSQTATNPPAALIPPSVQAPALPPLIIPTPPPNIPLSPLQAALLTAWLASEAEQGLTVTASAKAPPADNAALIAAVLDRARALHGGRIGDADFLEIWAVRPEPYDPLPGFLQAVASDRLAQWTANLTPPYAGYEGLRTGLAAYQAIRTAGGWPKLIAKATPEAIRARLIFEDKAVTPTEPITEALQRAQRRYGLNPTGLLDARTLAALNVPVEDRIAAIMANMERWRWMPQNLPVNRVQVNIAAAVLTMFEGDEPVASMRAVTGSPANQTPMLASNIHSVVLNPPWNVPASIAKKELWPKGRAALLAEGYKIVGTPATGERIVQPAGPNSALGQLKFDFDNPFAVYLHDTPSRAKFASFDRLASHGCVRLERPLALAELMLKDDPKFAGQVQATINTGKTQRVMLPRQVAVYLLYWTAFASANGTMNFRADPYGWDKLLATKIEASSRRADALTVVALKD